MTAALRERLATPALAAGLAALVFACGGRQVDDTAPQLEAEPGLAPADSVGPDTPVFPIPPLGLIKLAEPLPEPTRHTVRLCAGGDVMLGTNLDTSWAGRAAARLGRSVPALPDADRLLEPLRPLVRDADVILLNIEGAIGEGNAPPKCRPGSRSCYAFRQPAQAAGALRGLSYRATVVGNVANNHALDAGDEGLAATVDHLETADVRITGTDTLATVAVTELGDTVAILGFSTAQSGPDPRDLGAVARHVARARASYGRVAVTMHMGAEGAAAQRTRDETESYLGEDRGNAVAFAHAAIDAGASAVIGHGPHVMRAAEWRNGALILYSLGNLLTYGPFNLSEPLNRGAIACVDLAPEGGVSAAVVRSTVQQRPGVVFADPTGRAAWLVDSLSALDFPTTGARLYGEAAAAPPRP